jgi:uncharacterized membrane-anchored protein YitT (DUF2179 family)
MARNLVFQHKLAHFFQVFLGILSASFGLKGFLLPSHFLDGGVTGIALLVNRLMEIDLSLLIVTINIPFLLLGFYQRFNWLVFRSIISVGALALFIFFLDFPVITEDKVLIAVFGGFFLGMGIGLSIRGGAVLDGSEILAIYLSQKLKMTIGRIILVFNIILFLITALLITPEIALYSILTFLVASRTTDYIIHGIEEYIGITIVSNCSDEVKKAIYERLGVGITIYKGKGGFESEGAVSEREILHTIITRLEVRKLHLILDEIDPEAFVIEYDVHDVRGGMVRKMFQLGK